MTTSDLLRLQYEFGERNVKLTLYKSNRRRLRPGHADHGEGLMRRALILLPLLLLVGCRTSLFEGLDEDQANRIIAVLSHHGIDGVKERNTDKTWNVSVDDGDAVPRRNWPAPTRCRAAATRISANCSAARG